MAIKVSDEEQMGKVSVSDIPQTGNVSVASQSLSDLIPGIKGYTSPNLTAMKPKPVGMISSGQAITNLNEDKARLDTMEKPMGTDFKGQIVGDYNIAYKGPAGDTVYVKDPSQAPTGYTRVGGTTGTTGTGTATFVNANGQEMELTQDQLSNQSYQDFLKANGYTMSKSSGVLPSGDPTQTALESGVSELNRQMEDLTRGFLDTDINNDPELQGIIDQIKQKYARMTEEMKKTNSQRESAYKSLGYRQGTTQYAGAVQLGIEGEELKQANQRLLDIANEEQSAISAAKSAYQTGKWEIFSKTMDALEKIRKNKSEELSNYNQKLAAVDAKLQADREFEFEVFKYQNELAEKAAQKAKPMTLSPGQILYDPETNQELFRVPERPEKGEIVKGENGEIFRYNPNTNEMTLLYESAADAGVSDSAMDWAAAIRSGQAKLSDITGDPNLKSQVISAMKSLPPDTKAIGDAESMIEVLKSLYNPETKKQHPGMNSAVGPAFTGAITRTWLTEPLWGERTGFLGIANQYVSKKALEELISSKKEGATFGALSDREMDILKAAATKLGSWEITDKNGRVTGYKTTEANVRKAIEEMITDYQKVINESKGMSGGGKTIQDKITDYGIQNPAARSFIEDAYNPETKNPATGKPYTEQDIMEVLGISFNQGGSGTPIATINKIKDFSNVITDFGKAVATGIEAGSKYWKYGLDLALAGGRGAPVKTPISGTVVSAKNEGAWGNSVKIKTPDGRIIRLSHLDSIKVKPGQTVSSGTLIGGQGNTGKTYGKTGIHLDVTVYKPDGKPYTSKEVAAMFNTNLA